MTNLFTQSLNEEEQKLFRLYGKLPNKKDILQKKLEVRTARSYSISQPNNQASPGPEIL